MHCGVLISTLTPPTPTEELKALAEFGEEPQDDENEVCDAGQQEVAYEELTRKLKHDHQKHGALSGAPL
jgi:hypothetical protein